MIYHPRSRPWYQSDPILSWHSPLHLMSASSYDPPPGTFPLMSPAAQRMMAPEDLKPLHPDTPISPPPHGQQDGSQKEPSPSTLTKKTTLTTLNPSPVEVMENDTPHSRTILLPETMMTPSTLMDQTTSGPTSPLLTETFSDLYAPRPGSYEEATWRLATTSEGMTEYQWTTTLPLTEGTLSQEQEDRRLSQHEYSPIETERYTLLCLDTDYEGSTTSEPHRNNMESTSNEFDTFNYDEETFGGYTAKSSWDYSNYIAAPRYSTSRYPFPLPDSPPYQIWQHGQYHGPRTSHLYAGQGEEGGTGRSQPPSKNPPDDPPETPAERLQCTKELAEWKAQYVEELKKEVEEAEWAHDTHIQYWNLPNQNKGKGPNHGRPSTPPGPEWRKALHE
ncbi:hypothetical protein ARMSODRAFT_1013579 [Armillaria solidipes]|uniref:Uncharacterized protein n=1 Tax=Armillaria solidipes TaxID=1076256 RepID=A0A2H3BUR2_9AGAR|nr:hypothetical protein ARMSODRAFT_1013579 [Armillaria solidipes]